MIIIKLLISITLVILWVLFEKPNDENKKHYEFLVKGKCENNAINIISRNERMYCYRDQFSENFESSLPSEKLNPNLLNRNFRKNGKNNLQPKLNCFKQLTKGLSENEVHDRHQIPVYIQNQQYFQLHFAPGVQILNSSKEIIDMLKPVPVPDQITPRPKFNETNDEKLKRRMLEVSKPGTCVALFFYGTSCIQSEKIAKIVRSLPSFYPDIHFGAVDAFKHIEVSNVFGILSVPTVLLFHQGVLFYEFKENVENIFYLINQTTNAEPFVTPLIATDFYIRDVFQPKLDYYLYLAWFFIALCTILYFINSKFYTILIEILKRNWKESGAGLVVDNVNHATVQQN